MSKALKVLFKRRKRKKVKIVNMSSSILSNIRPSASIWLKVVAKPATCRLANFHSGFGRSAQPLMKLTCVGFNDNFVTKIPVAFMSTPSSSKQSDKACLKSRYKHLFSIHQHPPFKSSLRKLYFPL